MRSRTESNSLTYSNNHTLMRYLTFLLLTATMMAGCAKALNLPFERTGEVNAVSHENSIVTLRSQARAETQGKAVYYAERNAMENLLFKGIPNSNQESPILPSENKAWSDHAGVLKSLLIDGDYRRFIMDSYTQASNKVSGAYLIEQVTKIDLKALRKHLEQEGVAKKFGL